MTKSALQIARAAPPAKLPKALKKELLRLPLEGNYSVSSRSGKKSRNCFLIRMNAFRIKFEATDEATDFPASRYGVILSGGQAPGGANNIRYIRWYQKLNEDAANCTDSFLVPEV